MQKRIKISKMKNYKKRRGQLDTTQSYLRLPNRPLWQSTVNRNFTTSATVYSSATNFNYTNLLSDLSTSGRSAKLKRVSVQIAPVNILGTATAAQQLYAQVNTYDLRSAQYVPLSDNIPLSVTRPTNIHVTLPNDLAAYMSTVSATVAIQIVFHNPSGAAANAFNTNLLLNSVFELSRDVPSNV
jgi:hypothetical protein